MPDDAQLATYARLLRLSPISEVAAPAVPTTALTVAATRRRYRSIAGLWSLLLLVALPVCLTTAYFGLFAADRYESESTFILRMPGRTIPLATSSSFIPTGGVLRAAEDGFIVKEYLQSRSAMKWLESHADLRAAYGSDKAKWDWIWRFPNPFVSNSEEGLFKQYQRMMTAKFDTDTGLNTVKTVAFSPQEAQRLATSLLAAAETLVNRLNERSREDAIALARAEVVHMRERTVAAQAALTSFRERERLVDPSQATLSVVQTIGRLSLEAAQANVQINELAQSSGSSPQIAQLRNKLAALEGQIAIERQRLAGSSQAIAPRIAEYERLMLEREFAEKALISAMTALEAARVDAQRQQIYLERVAGPSLPDRPAYPWRVISCLAALALALMTWRIWRIVVKDTLRHNDL